MTDYSTHKFRKIFVVEPTHEVSILSKYSSQIIFLTRGDEKIDDISERINSLVSDFDPDTDAIIPMGRTPSNLMAGFAVLRSVIAKFISEQRSNSPICITFGVYKNEDYIFITTELT